MVLSHDRERGRVSLSTKKLEPTPGDMIRNPKLVFEKVNSFLALVKIKVIFIVLLQYGKIPKALECSSFYPFSHLMIFCSMIECKSSCSLIAFLINMIRRVMK